MKTHLRKLWDSLRSTYWFVPAAMMAIAALLYRVTLSLDHLLHARRIGTITWLYNDDIDSLRTLLLTIAGTVIGIVGVVFSILMVPLTIAATQFGPRLLRTYLRDIGTQITLGTFTATLTFCILVVLQLRDPAAHIPQVSATMGLLLGLISFGVLLYFINHVAVSIQAPVVVAQVSKELQQVIDRDFPDLLEGASSTAIEVESTIMPDVKHTPQTVMAKVSGYVQLRDDKKLLHLAQEHNSILKLLYNPGDFVVQGIPIALIWSATEITTAQEEAINAAFILGNSRTLIQDVTFGINELAEVAIRALSAAINDPFTVMTCIDWLGAALCKLCNRTFPPSNFYDEQGNLRLVSSPVTFAALTDAAFNQVREYGRTSKAVTLRLIDTIAVIAQCAKTAEQRKVLLEHATLVEQGCHIGLPEPADRQIVTAHYEAIKQQLAVAESTVL